MSRSVPYVSFICFFFFFFNDPATTAIYTLSLHDALPIFPLLICALIADPPASPCSASKLLVTTLTASSDSSAGTYAATCGSQMFVVLTPSIRVLLELRLAPFTLKTSARDGFEGTE